MEPMRPILFACFFYDSHSTSVFSNQNRLVNDSTPYTGRSIDLAWLPFLLIECPDLAKNLKSAPFEAFGLLGAEQIGGKV